MAPRTGDTDGGKRENGGGPQSPVGALGGAAFESPPASTAFEALGFRTDPSVSASSSSSNYDVSSSSASSSNGSSVSSAIYSISPSCFSLPTASLDYPARLLKPTTDILQWNRSTRSKTQSHEEQGELVRPANFAQVAHQVYRSSFPQEEHLPFLKSLALKSVITLVIDDYPSVNRKWIDDEGIQFFQFGIPSTKDPAVNIPDKRIHAALSTILDEANLPILIHCNKGKHRTGCLVGCLRKVQEWSLQSIVAEYHSFAAPKARVSDESYINRFDPSSFLSSFGNSLPRWCTAVSPDLPCEQIVEEEPTELIAIA